MDKMSDEQEATIARLKEKIALFAELVEERQQELNIIVRETQRIEDYSQGVQDSLQKLENHINSHKKNILDLHIKQQINSDAFSFIDGLLGSILGTIKNTSLENEKVFLTKKIEISNKNSEIAKLSSKKSNYEKKIEELINPKLDLLPSPPPPPPQSFIKENKVELKRKNRKFRPDKDPTTKAGRAALDLAKRRKKAKDSLEEETEDDSKSVPR